jgi:elongation factor G
VDIFPSPDELQFAAEGGEIEADINAPATAVVFKTVADPFVGKLSYFKVVSGKLKQDTKLINMRTENEEKLSKVM